jgi:hypothetical protein
MREFLTRILKFVVKHWGMMLLTAAGTAIGGRLLWLYKTYLKDWCLSIRHVELPGWAWILLCVVEVFLVVYFIRGLWKNLGNLKNPRDVISAIECWFADDNSMNDKPETNTSYYFAGVEESLNLKRGSSKRYLPMIAWKHGYAFRMGKKTFTLTPLTHQNDPTVIFEQYLNNLTSEKEVTLFCKTIDSVLGWPEGATKQFLLYRPFLNVNFGIEIKDMVGNKIRIIRKE